MNKIEDENEIKEEKNEIKDEIKDENEIKEDNDDIQIDAKELEFIEQPEIEIKTEEDLDKITKDIEKIEINDKLNEETVLLFISVTQLFEFLLLIFIFVLWD